MSRKLLVISDLRGGFNQTDPPLSLPDNQSFEAVNVDWFDGMIGRKRDGLDSVNTTGGTGFSGPTTSLIRHVPGSSEAAAELWATDGAIIKRYVASASMADVTLDDAISTTTLIGASLNGKLFLAYDTAVDRLHVYDPNLAAPRVRRVGIDPGTNAPTVADTGAGAYPAVARVYRIRFMQLRTPITDRLSEPTPTVTFTPSGGGAAARITRPAAPGEGETHWFPEASFDGGSTWFQFPGAATVIATTTTDDSNTQATWIAGTVSAIIGTYSLFPSVKYLLTDGNRLLGAGSYEASGATSGGKNSRIWFTPVLGSSDKGDDERIPNTVIKKNWIDLNENDGGAITGLGGPLNGDIYAFKFRQVWRLTATGDDTAPYLAKKLRDDIGCTAHQAISIGDDGSGHAAIYFLSQRGPYRILSSGEIQYLGHDLEATKSTGIGTGSGDCAVYYSAHHQWWLKPGTLPINMFVFDPFLAFIDGHGRVRGGWATWQSEVASKGMGTVIAMVQFASTLGATMSTDLIPYVSINSGSVLLARPNATTGDDAGAAFKAYVKTKPIPLAPLGQNASVGLMSLQAKAQSGVTITVTVDRDYGLETRDGTVLLTATASESRVLRKIENTEMAGAGVVQLKIGDSAPVSNRWTLEAIVIPMIAQEIR